MPCYNAEKYVAAAVQSALDQTWPNKEIIVVDDGSTDGSGEILDSIRSRGVKVIHERFGNAAATRNRAFRECAGEFIKFFDADDLLDPKTIESQVVRLADGGDAVASSEWGRFYGDDLSTFRLNPQSVWRDMNSLEWLLEAWQDARPMMQPGLYLIPRAALERSGLWDEKLSLIDDFEFFARVLCHVSEVRFTPGARLYYRSGLQGSLSGRKSRTAVESAFHSLLDGTTHLLSRRQDDKAKHACANVLQDFIYTYYPDHRDLTHKMSERVEELGGSDLPPSGPPRFEMLRSFTGWKFARRLQVLVGRRERSA
jgi:glycosyltransferase involved in cell wall biosynthesis